MDDKLAVITTNINPSVIVDFLKSIDKQRNKNFHVYVIDITRSERRIDGKNISVIQSENKGYSYAVNKGLKQAVDDGYSKFCVINDDTFFEEDFIDNALRSLKNNPHALIGGKIFYAPGYEYHKQRYDKNSLGRVLWYAGGEFDWKHVLSRHIGVDEIDSPRYNEQRQTDFVTGALMLFDKEVLDKVGLWDESYFLYFEDADFCVRATRSGIRLLYDPGVIIWHKVSQSTDGSGSELHVRYQTRNRLRFGLKYAPFKTKLHLLKNAFLGILAKK